MVWDNVSAGLEEGNAVIAWQRQAEQGFSFDTIGENRRIPAEFDGLALAPFLPKATIEND